MAKRRHPKHESTRKSAEKVKQILEQNYEPGRQDRCKEWVWRNIVRKETGISRRTFFRYIEDPKENAEDPNQLKLFE